MFKSYLKIFQMRQIMASLTKWALLTFFYISGDLCVTKISVLGITPRSHGKILICHGYLYDQNTFHLVFKSKYNTISFQSKS